MGAPKAITAGAHKLARIIFHLVTTKQEFDESRFAADQLRSRERQQAQTSLGSEGARIPTRTSHSGEVICSLGDGSSKNRILGNLPGIPLPRWGRDGGGFGGRVGAVHHAPDWAP